MAESSNIGKVLRLPIEEEIKLSYLDYAMSVIVGRALPDAKDGLKPVQRRILYAMMELGLRSNQPYRKSARIVGETMGKYHPHGDAAIYDAMVRMAQDFSMRYPLVDGQGNFGSIDGDPPAAMRYTEARLSPLGEEMLRDINEDTVDWGPNFDETLQEPLVLPSLLPNLLVNGSSGIAVGMATNIPPHNLSEVVDALCLLIERGEDVELGDIIEVMPGPDFPTGGTITGREGIINAYRTGRGKIVLRGRVSIEQMKRGKTSLIVTEIPYMVNKVTLIEIIARGVQEGHLTGIADLRDESDRDGIRVVIELQRDADPHLVLKQLFSRTPLQTTFGVINLALVDGVPRELGLIELLKIFLDHRRDVVRRRTNYRLRKAEERAHIVEGLVKALDMIDEIIALIKRSKDAQEARVGLMDNFGFTELQAQAILDMRLQRLTNLERSKLEEELRHLLKDIEMYHSILENPSVLDSVVKEELTELKRQYGDARKTEIVDELVEVADDELIPEEDIVVVLSKDGYLRRASLGDYHLQGRGGKGIKGLKQKDDEVEMFAATTTHHDIFLFTSKGRVFAIKGYLLPEPKNGKGKHVSSFFTLEENERVVAIKEDTMHGARFVFFATERGIAKRLDVSELANLTRAGRRVITLDDGDSIARVRFTSGEDELLFVSAKGQALRTSEQEFRPMGRQARGVRAIRLSESDVLVGCEPLQEGMAILFISEKGVGKRTSFDEFPLHHRGGSGVRAMRLSSRTGSLVGAWSVTEDDEVMIVTSKGRVTRIAVKNVPVLSRTATGSILVRLDQGDSVADITIVRDDAMEEV
ncbi:MAG: DNA gyrase subunit A [Acetomicrobium sp.]